MANGIGLKNIIEESGSDSTAYGSIEWKRLNNFVCVTIRPSSIAKGEWRVMGNLPSDIRPSDYLYNMPWVDIEHNNYTAVLIRAKTDTTAGDVTVNGNIATATTITFTI